MDFYIWHCVLLEEGYIYLRKEEGLSFCLILKACTFDGKNDDSMNKKKNLFECVDEETSSSLRLGLWAKK